MNKINLVAPAIFYLLVLVAAIIVSVLSIPNRGKMFNLAVLVLLTGIFSIFYWCFITEEVGWGLTMAGVLSILSLLGFEALLLTSNY